MSVDAVERAFAVLRAGDPVVIADGHGALRNSGMLVMAADAARPDALLRLLRLAGGWMYLALTDERCDELGLDLVSARDDSLVFAPLTAAIMAREGVTTGVSIADRARTIAVAIDPACGRRDIRFGGNVLPLRARRGGSLERAGFTEASIDLIRMTGVGTAAVAVEIVDEDGSEIHGPALQAFSERTGVPLVTIDEVIARRRRTERLVRQIVSARLPTPDDVYQAFGYLDDTDSSEHMALVRGDLRDADEVLVYIHKACWEGDVFRSRRCRCRAKLDAAQDAVAAAERGVIIHLAYPHYMTHADRPLDEQIRDMGVGAQILADLGIRRIRVLTDHARPLVGLGGYELTVVGHDPLLGAEDETPPAR